MRELDWHETYNSNLKGKIVDEAFSHPAKMAWGLTVRIFQHLFDEGWLREGDLVADPFGGIGTTALVAASFGCPCIVVELEEKFCKLAEENFSLNEGQWEKMGKPMPICIQGDSRQFASLIREAAHAIITSPPYSESLRGQEVTVDEKRIDRLHKAGYTRATSGLLRIQNAKTMGGGYGTTEGQIGAMKEGKLDKVVSGIVTSPPYGRDVEPHRAKPMEEWRGTEKWGGPHSVVRAQGYGQSPGQLGGMPEGDHKEVVDGIITSPPYVSAGWKADEDPANPIRREAERRKLYPMRPEVVPGRYSADPANVGNLPEGSHEAVVDAICTSPPYEAMIGKRSGPSGLMGGTFRLGRGDMQANREGYSSDDDNIGNKAGSTYWQAVSEVYQECLKALKPSGVMAVVVKAFVRNKKIVDLPSQTLELLQAIGFEPLERVRAWLTSEVTQKSLMPDIRPDYTKARKSFFRRLAERKGSPPIDFEIVLIVRK